MRKTLNMLAAVVAMTLVFCMTGCDNSDSGDGGAQVYDLTGAWTVTISHSDGRVRSWVFNIEQDGATLSGTSYQANEPRDIASLSGTITDGAVGLTEDWGDGETYVYTGTATSDTSMSGNAANPGGRNAGTWIATKQ